MGNSFTKQSKDQYLKSKPIGEIIDYIATKYILTSNFKSLEKLTDKNYCDNLVILTSDIISKYFTHIEVEYLTQRIEKGVEINKTNKETLTFFNKDDLSKFNTETQLRKKRMCIGIAKYYIKIAHLYSAIVMTINPIYKYKDPTTGNTITSTLYEKDKIPPNTPRTITKTNICSHRINSLTKNNTFINTENGSNTITVQPDFCSINNNIEGNVKSLIEETGIKELEELYYDDYDYVQGKFTGMKPETKKTYEEDVKIFYKTFTGSNSVPSNIKSFKDITLKDYSLNKLCDKSSPFYKEKFIGKYDLLGENIFAEYAIHIKNMIERTNTNQEKLLQIINDIFVYYINSDTNTKEIRINPKINEKTLDTIIKKARDIIIKLYLTCENDYKTGLKIYQKLIEKKIYEITQKQINTLNENIDEAFSQSQSQSRKNNIKPEEKQSENIENEKELETIKDSITDETSASSYQTS